MLENIDITSQQKSYQPTDKLKSYIAKKLGKLDRRLSRSNRDDARLEVKLKKSKSKSGEQFSCEAILHTPQYKLAAEETTPNMFASVDVVEAKLLAQIKKHKETHNPNQDKKQHNRARKLLNRLRRTS